MRGEDGVGGEAAFAALVEAHRRELRVHCYRMLGSFDEAEDLEDPDHRAFAISVLRIEHGLVAETTAFHDTHLFPAFDLPLRLPTDDVSGTAPSPWMSAD